MKVLLVDDDLLVCKGLRKLIPWESFGFDTVLEAHNGETAYALAIANSPDLILSDISMPVMDGLAFCEKISKTMADTPVILLSAYESFDYARTAMKFGVAHYLLKPIDKPKMEEMKNIITEIIAQKADRTQALGMLGGNLRTELAIALHAADYTWVTNLLETRIRGLDVGVSEKKTLYIALVHMLCESLAETDTAHYLQIPREAALREVMQLQSVVSLENYVQELFFGVLREAENRLTNKDDVIIGKVKEYIAANYANEDLSVAYLSQIFYVSPSYLGTVFKNSTGVGLSAYITECRVEKACEELKKPFGKVSDAAAMVGFHDPLYFTKVFKKVKGITPSEYQSLHI